MGTLQLSGCCELSPLHTPRGVHVSRYYEDWTPLLPRRHLTKYDRYNGSSLQRRCATRTPQLITRTGHNPRLRLIVGACTCEQFRPIVWRELKELRVQCLIVKFLLLKSTEVSAGCQGISGRDSATVDCPRLIADSILTCGHSAMAMTIFIPFSSAIFSSR